MPSARALTALSPGLLLAAALLCITLLASAQAIYSCTDRQGRHLKSDRPMLDCLDREQRELGRSGATRRVIPPTPTAAERAARESQAHAQARAREREQNLLRRDQALVTRYPDMAAHEAARAAALGQTQAVADSAERRIAELTAERAALDEEMEFYRKDPSRAPTRLRRSIEDNAQALATQRRAIAGQQDEQQRIQARFDEEAARLQTLWTAKAADAAGKR